MSMPAICTQGAPIIESQKLGVVEDCMSDAERLFHYTYATRHDEVHFLEYRMLHRMNIFNLQNRLAESKASSWTKRGASDGELLDLKVKLHEYSKYLRSRAVTIP